MSVGIGLDGPALELTIYISKQVHVYVLREEITATFRIY